MAPECGGGTSKKRQRDRPKMGRATQLLGHLYSALQDVIVSVPDWGGRGFAIEQFKLGVTGALRLRFKRLGDVYKKASSVSVVFEVGAHFFF